MRTVNKGAISEYRERIEKANKEHTKKELFKDLLHRLYTGNEEIQDIINLMSEGAERTILSIPREDKLHRGSADTLYNNVIIEFENDLKKTGVHAKEQLAGYLLGELARGEGYSFILIASDFITWQIYTPAVEQIPFLSTLKEHELSLIENTEARFVLTEGNEEDFYYWIDRWLFREAKQKATLQRVKDAFGHRSVTFIESVQLLAGRFQDAKKYGDVQVSMEQWRRFLSIAYGKFEATDETFMVHTYLSVFAKMLAFSVVSGNDYIEETVIKGVLEGSAFGDYQIKNFVENDFFHWILAPRNFPGLTKVFRVITQEISRFDFTNVDEDVLKGVYQELIDLDTRHALGEYYTPDWLCERVVNEFSFGTQSRILDPSCGSGSFLLAAIHRLRNLNPEITSEELIEAVYGIDIHPLSVQIAKTTLLIALGTELKNLKEPKRLNVLLANTLLVPKGTSPLHGDDFTIQIDRKSYSVNSVILQNANLYDIALDFCETLSGQNPGKAVLDRKEFIAMLSGVVGKQNGNAFAGSFYEIYKGLKKAKDDGRDSIWQFILSNTFKPYFMKQQFDYIIGNPPWFTYASIKNEEYQDALFTLAGAYNVRPGSAANMPHLEIAAIFLAHCTNYFLKAADKRKETQAGKTAFVLPRSFFSGDQHSNTREAKAKGFKLTKIWDLEKVQPLFNIPSCVFFADCAPVDTEIPDDGLPGIEFSGRLPAHNCNWEAAEKKITENPVRFFVGKLGKSSAFTTSATQVVQRENPYKKLFKQGATLVPRTFYFVDIVSYMPKDAEDFKDRSMMLRTARSVLPDAKAPWKGLAFTSTRFNSKYLFYTAISRSILPFCIHKPEFVVLPIDVVTSRGKQKIELLTEREMLHKYPKYTDALLWFQSCERLWQIHRTEKNKNSTSGEYLNWQNKLQAQNLNARYLVLYNASAKDANAGVLDRQTLPLTFIAESKTYVYFTNNLLEAHYLTAFLNAGFSNKIIKDFQTRGLFGARDVHKKILDVFFPKFNEKIKLHKQIAEASMHISEAAAQFIAEKNIKTYEGGLALGKLRTEIKSRFAVEIAAVEELLLNAL